MTIYLIIREDENVCKRDRCFQYFCHWFLCWVEISIFLFHWKI